MSHQFESGFFVARAAWHGLGTVLQDPPTPEQAIVQAGLDWRVLEEPVYQTQGQDLPVVLCKHLIRDRDRKRLSTVKPTYTPLQNQDACRWFAPLVEQGKVVLEAAGSLQGGKRIWLLGRITSTEAEICPHDWVRPYLLLHNSHDGSTAVWLQFTPVRVVCMNTLCAAASSRFGDLWQRKGICIPHTLALQEQLEKAQELLDCTQKEFQFSVEEYQAMANQEMDSEMLTGYLGRVLGSRRPRQHPYWGQLTANFERGPGNQGRTLWHAYNAVTDWIDRQQPLSAEEQLEFTWFGAGARLRVKAHQAALGLIDCHRQVQRSQSRKRRSATKLVSSS